MVLMIKYFAEKNIVLLIGGFWKKIKKSPKLNLFIFKRYCKNNNCIIIVAINSYLFDFFAICLKNPINKNHSQNTASGLGHGRCY